MSDPDAAQTASIRRDLARTIAGRIICPGEDGFESTVSLDNGRVRRWPRLAVVPLSAEDVAKTARYCAHKQIKLTVKSGGHGASGYCLNDEGIVLDLADLRHIRCGTRDATIVAGTGARWIEVYRRVEVSHEGLVVVGGGCSGVGLGGFLLGGGFSFVSRSYGLGCDSVSRMQFVSADGDIHELTDKSSSREERDLLWALRGGGGGNFGIVTEVELCLHERRSPAMMMGSITFPFDRAAEMLRFYNDWAPTLPPELAVYGMLRRFVDPRHGGAPVLMVRFAPTFNGAFEEGMELLNPLFERSPASAELYSMTLPQWESFIGNGTNIAGRHAYIRSVAMPSGGLNEDVVDLLVREMARAPSPDSYVVWTHAGGNIRTEDFAARSCFARRDAEFVFEVKAIWERDAPETEARTNIEWAVEFFDRLEGHGIGSYLNYIDPLLMCWPDKYYGTTYPNLLKVKERWDPDGRFIFQQGLGSAFKPTRTVPLDISPLERT